ncbi:MAG: hypothetical protein BWY95_02818 [Bacteroidetes bacterium ADurb.BinA104]|nr:MAG: hypothetical protein BWY95_02818 [Bacteroidetes bacterium ADurb.BinA104]
MVLLFIESLVLTIETVDAPLPIATVSAALLFLWAAILSTNLSPTLSLDALTIDMERPVRPETFVAPVITPDAAESFMVISLVTYVYVPSRAYWWDCTERVVELRVLFTTVKRVDELIAVWDAPLMVTIAI